MAWYDKYIVRVPGVVGGEPIIKGTRISVLAVVEYREIYDSLSRVARVFPDVPPECLEAALAYYKDHVEEIEGYRREHDLADDDIESTPNVFHLKT